MVSFHLNIIENEESLRYVLRYLEERMKKLLAIALMLTLLITAGCSTTPTGQAVEQHTLKIGVVGTLTGVGAYHGQQELKGLQLAAEKLQNEGVHITFIAEDSKAKPADAVTAVQKLIHADNVDFIIGDSWSSTTVAFVPVTNQQKKLTISPIAVLDELSNDDLFFRTIPSVRSMVVPLAEHAYKNMGIRRVAILRQDTPFGVEHANSFREEFTKLGGKIILEEKFDLFQEDVRSEILKAKEQNPDAIFNLHATGPRLGAMMKQARELGIDVRWLSSFGAENTPLVQTYGNIVDGLVYPYPFDLSDADTRFVNSYTQKYNELPDLGAANAYDALMLLGHAVGEVGKDPNAVKKYLLNIKNYPGASGKISFDKNGDVQKNILIKEIKDGKFVQIS